MNQKRTETLKTMISNYYLQKDIVEHAGKTVNMSLLQYLNGLKLSNDEIAFCIGENNVPSNSA